MKAREIKKSLVKRHQRCITNYATIQAEHFTQLKLLRAQIEELEDILDKYFGVLKSYFTDTTDVEDNIPF